MKQEYTEIVVLLDRSGSMQSAKDDHEGGLRSFVEDQKRLDGDVRFTLIQFDTANACEVVYNGAPIADVSDLELIPRGGTPLLDAVGLSIAHVAERLKGTAPDQVVVMVITDGHENSSREYTRAQIQSMIREYEEQHGWKFLYLGADVDAFDEAQGLAINTADAMKMRQSKAGIAASYAAFSENTIAARHLMRGGACQEEVLEAFEFTDSQRAAAADDDDETG